MSRFQVFFLAFAVSIGGGLVGAACSTGGEATELVVEPSATPTEEVEPRDYGVPDEDASMANPIPADAASVQRGGEIYETTCESCHGEEGRGDGRVAVNQNPKPVDFSAQHIKELTDGELFYIISFGVEDTAMQAFGFFDEDQRWHLVNYIRSLQE